MLRQGATRGSAAPNPPSNTRPAAPRPINTVINRENPVTWHCFGSRRCSWGTGRAPLSSPGPPLSTGTRRCPARCATGAGVQAFSPSGRCPGSREAWLRFGCSLPPAASALNLAEGCGRSCELKAGEHEEGVATQSGPPASSVALETPRQGSRRTQCCWPGRRMVPGRPRGPSQAGGDG